MSRIGLDVPRNTGHLYNLYTGSVFDSERRAKAAPPAVRSISGLPCHNVSVVRHRGLHGLLLVPGLRCLLSVPDCCCDLRTCISFFYSGDVACSGSGRGRVYRVSHTTLVVSVFFPCSKACHFATIAWAETGQEG